MHSNCDIFITFSKYLIRPQQRRIFAIICNNSADDIIAHCANKKLAEYCNIMRQHRDISGKLINIDYDKVLYYDIYGYRYFYLFTNTCFIRNKRLSYTKLYNDTDDRLDILYSYNNKIWRFLLINNNIYQYHNNNIIYGFETDSLLIIINYKIIPGELIFLYVNNNLIRIRYNEIYLI